MLVKERENNRKKMTNSTPVKSMPTPNRLIRLKDIHDIFYVINLKYFMNFCTAEFWFSIIEEPAYQVLVEGLKPIFVTKKELDRLYSIISEEPTE
jgi:hypothetical protein